MEAMHARYPRTAITLVEEAANGAAVVNTLKSRIPGLLAVTPLGGKLARASAAAPRVEAGQILLPRPRTSQGDLRIDREWVDDFVSTSALFPKSAHDDDVDALSQLVAWIEEHPHVEAASALREPEPWFKPRYQMCRDASGSLWGLRENRRVSHWIFGRPVVDGSDGPEE